MEGTDPLENAREKITSALLIQHMPESYLVALHRILWILCELDDSYSYDPVDLLPYLAEMVDDDASDYDFVSNCVSVGSEFEIISIKRDSLGRLILLDVGIYAVPFLAALIGDYNTALEAAIRVNKRYSQGLEGSDSDAHAALSLYGHWAAIGASAVEATLKPSDKSLICSFRDCLTENLHGFVADEEINMWLTYESMHSSLEKLEAVSLISKRGEFYEVNRNSAIRFLTAIGEYDLLADLKSR